MKDSWSSGNSYERFMGRWSTLIVREFLDWLAIPTARSWLDVGCGTGTLTKQILERYQPKEIIALDSSSDFISYAQQVTPSRVVRFRVGRAQSMDFDSNCMDAVVSGLVLNFVPQPESAVAEMLRVTKPGGKIGIFLWDYADGMEMLRYFWNAAVALDTRALRFDEGIRFPLCREGQLDSLVRDGGLQKTEAKPIEVKTVFRDFDDYWTPFLGNVGPAPSYVMSLNQGERENLKGHLRDSLPVASNGTVTLKARAWAVKGTV